MRRIAALAALSALLSALIAPAGAAPAPAPVKVGTYNVEYGHPRLQHSRSILNTAVKYRLGVMAVQESQDYHRTLRKIAPKKVYRLIALGKGGSRNALLVRRSAQVTAKGYFISPGWWPTRQGGRAHTAPNVWARVNGTIYVSIHAPVHAWTPCGRCSGGRAWAGGSHVRDAYAKFVISVIRFSHRVKGRLVILGDWNSSPGARGKWSPNYLRKKIGGKFIASGRSTGHGEVDFAISRGVKILSPVRVRPQPRSDHHLVYWRQR